LSAVHAAVSWRLNLGWLGVCVCVEAWVIAVAVVVPLVFIALITFAGVCFYKRTCKINQSIIIYHEQFDKTNDTSNLTGEQGTRVH